jgi:GT2 family glycosyltransferase
MAVSDEPLAETRATFASLRAQTTRSWSLTVVATEPWLPVVDSMLKETLGWRARRRTHVVVAPQASPIGDLVGLALARNVGTPVALIHPGDIWARDTVSTLGAAVSPSGVAYGDEDRVGTDGALEAPRFKPDVSPDFLLTTSYVGRPLAMGAEVARQVPPLRSSQRDALEHECALLAFQLARSVTHIPEVLCHRTADPSDSGEMASVGREIDHVTEILRRRGDDAVVTVDRTRQTYVVSRSVPAGTTASIVIPFRDEPRFLRTCIESVTATSGDIDVELVLIDNGSTEPETMTLLDTLAQRPRVQVLTDLEPFNWARLNNNAARGAGGDVLVFLNNDIEARRGGWLTALCAHALRADVGAVGARLLYPDRRLQHCGIVVGLNGAAGHPLVGLPEDRAGYLKMAVATRECSAVTGACLATRREVFSELGGFDESLGVDLNDVDFCLRAGEAGYRTIYEPAAELTHYESPSRGTAGGVDDIVNFLARWEHYIKQGDRYFNPHLTRMDPSCGLARANEGDAWNTWQSILNAR